MIRSKYSSSSTGAPRARQETAHRSQRHRGAAWSTLMARSLFGSSNSSRSAPHWPAMLLLRAESRRQFGRDPRPLIPGDDRVLKTIMYPTMDNNFRTAFERQDDIARRIVELKENCAVRICCNFKGYVGNKSIEKIDRLIDGRSVRLGGILAIPSCLVAEHMPQHA
jgi:hypothetical protein